MQFNLVAILLACLAYAWAEDKGCAGGYKNGDQVDRGRYWYMCKDGQLEPKGCYSDSKVKMNVKESFKSGNYVLECVIDDKGMLSFDYKGCVSESGKESAPGETLEDDKYWYTCAKEGDHLKLEVGGCVSEGKRYKIGETTEKSDFVFECKRWANTTCSVCPVGCLKEGKRYNVGESFEKNTFWYMCTKDDGKLEVKCVGCIHENQQLKDGDRYVKADNVYECAIRKDKDPEHRLVGCHDVDNGATIERRLGCQWTKGTPPNQYVMKCDAKDDNTAYKEVVRCFFGSSEKGGYEIEPGCYKIIDNNIVACRTTDSGPIIETFPAEQLQQAYYKGVRFCNGSRR
jgi:hypothetical protein